MNKAKAFESLLRECWFSQIRDIEPGEDLLKIVRDGDSPITESELKYYLADAILNQRFSIEEYERLTDLDFQTPTEVADDLRELWRLMFGDETVALPSPQP